MEEAKLNPSFPLRADIDETGEFLENLTPKVKKIRGTNDDIRKNFGQKRKSDF